MLFARFSPGVGWYRAFLRLSLCQALRFSVAGLWKPDFAARGAEKITLLYIINYLIGVDVAQVGLALRYATRRSLVMLDEFGKGTQPVDGVALLAALVRARFRIVPT